MDIHDKISSLSNITAYGLVVLPLVSIVLASGGGILSLIINNIMQKKIFKIPKEFYEGLEHIKIELATIKCVVCGEEILDTPTNRMQNLLVDNFLKSKKSVLY